MSNPWRELLPTSVEVCGTEYEIRSDYRAVLDICAAMADVDLDGRDKSAALLDIFYPEFLDMPPEHYQEALDRCFWFIDCGDSEPEQRHVRLMDWEQDFKYIIAPINRVTGQEVRSAEYIHWWTFIAAYYEIGDCTFAQIVRIRNQLSRGKALDKNDREWYQRNRKLVDLEHKYSNAESELVKKWGI